MDDEKRYFARSKGGKVSGNNAYKNKTGIHSFTSEQRKNASSKGGKMSSSQKWKCLVTGFISNSPGLSRYQRARNIDTSLRVKLDVE
jgi:hypothetical protein